MVIDCLYTFEKKTNYFMTNKEVELLWNHVTKHYQMKWGALIGLCLFRGMRIGEAVAVNLYDFLNKDFNQLTIVLEKSHIKDNFPMLIGFSDYLKEYISLNSCSFKDGCLFPFYSKKSPNNSHIDIRVAEAMMAKWRNALGKDHPEFLDRHKIYQVQYLILKMLNDNSKITIKKLCSSLCKHKRTVGRCIDELIKKGYYGYNGITEEGKKYISTPKFKYRYRISTHSCRRWFETTLHDSGIRHIDIADIMRYKDRNTPLTYLSPYEVWKKEPEILENSFGEIWQKLKMIEKGQTRLDSF